MDEKKMLMEAKLLAKVIKELPYISEMEGEDKPMAMEMEVEKADAPKAEMKSDMSEGPCEDCGKEPCECEGEDSAEGMKSSKPMLDAMLKG